MLRVRFFCFNFPPFIISFLIPPAFSFFLLILPHFSTLRVRISFLKRMLMFIYLFFNILCGVQVFGVFFHFDITDTKFQQKMINLFFWYGRCLGFSYTFRCIRQ
jgi:hypothetical protein